MRAVKSRAEPTETPGVTLLDPGTDLAPAPQPHAPGRRHLHHAWRHLPDAAPDAAVVAGLGWWATYLTWGTGGREPHVLSVGCALAALGWLLVRPDRVLRPGVLVLGHALSFGAVAVVLTAPTGLAGRDDAAAWVLTAQTGLLLLAWARDDVRRLVLLTALLAAGGAQFAQGWLPWWGAQDPEKLFQGTFYWHNQVGIFLAAVAVLALAVLAGGGPLARLGWVVAPLATAGTLFTTSRGSQLALLLGAALLLVLAGRSVAPRLRLLGGLALGWGTSWLLTGPPFFDERVAPTAGTAARSESFVDNGVTRVEDWAAAWEVFARWPLTGGGFDGFRAGTVAAEVGERAGATAYAHNGYLQALSDGGLLLALPLLVVLAGLGWAVARALPAAVRRGDLAQVGAAVTLLVLGLHCGMDFDWAYPSLLLMVPLVAVLALPPATGAVDPAAAGSHRRTHRWGSGAISLAPALLLLLAAVAAWGGGLSHNAPLG